MIISDERFHQNQTIGVWNWRPYRLDDHLILRSRSLKQRNDENRQTAIYFLLAWESDCKSANNYNVFFFDAWFVASVTLTNLATSPIRFGRSECECAFFVVDDVVVAAFHFIKVVLKRYWFRTLYFEFVTFEKLSVMSTCLIYLNDDIGLVESGCTIVCVPAPEEYSSFDDGKTMAFIIIISRIFTWFHHWNQMKFINRSKLLLVSNIQTDIVRWVPQDP